MAPIVAPDVARFTINGTYAGEAIANVWDMRPVIVGGPVLDREAWCLDQAGLLFDVAAVTLAQNQSALYAAVSCTWVDLNSLEGSVGETTGETGPWNGLASSAVPFPGNVAVRVNKETTSARGLRNGRSYLVGYGEDLTSAANPNVIQTGDVATLQGDVDSFLEGITIERDVEGTTVSSQVCVVHTRRPTPDADPVFASTTAVTALTVQARLASQRRRLTPGTS